MLPLCRARSAPAFRQTTTIQWRHASSRARKAPSLAGQRRQPTSGVNAAPIPSPPLDLFTMLREAGFPDLGSAEALNIARACIAAFQKSAETRSLNLTKDIHPDLRKISAVCSILELSPKHLRVYEWLSEKLVLTGDSWALHTQGWKLLASSAKDDQLGVFPKIKALAQQGHSWWAMTLYGHYLKQKGQLENAASWHRKAMDLAKPCTREEVPLPMTRSGIQPWAAYATIKMQLGDIDEAEKAALVGALEYHKPQGYMMLTSVLYAKKECDKLEEYLTRAAMSHNSAACYQLGEIYRLWHHGPERVENDGYHGKFLPKEMLPRVMSLSSRYHSPDEYYNIAKEWLELASIQEHPLASLQLAVLLREENKHEEGISCLDRAAKTPKYADVVAELRELWHESDADINSIMRKCVEL